MVAQENRKAGGKKRSYFPSLLIPHPSVGVFVLLSYVFFSLFVFFLLHAFSQIFMRW